MPSRVTQLAVLGLTVVVAVAAGCSSAPDSQELNTREPEVAAVSPDQTRAPDGTTADPRLGGAITVDDLAVGADGTVAVLTDSGTTVLLTGTDEAAPRTVRLSTPGTSIAAGRDDELVVTTPNGLVRVDADSGETTDVAVEAGAASVTPWEDGYAVGTPTGSVLTIGVDGSVDTSVSGLASVDELVTASGELVALDTRQTSVTAITPGAGRLGAALRAGEGATRMTSCPDGAIAVADTADDELLIFTADDLIMRQRYPVAGSPFAVACDGDGTVWITVTALNEVVGFDISSGMPTETARFSTVRQPDSLAVDARTGELFVGSNSSSGVGGAGVQVIPTRE